MVYHINCKVKIAFFGTAAYSLVVSNVVDNLLINLLGLGLFGLILLGEQFLC